VEIVQSMTDMHVFKFLFLMLIFIVAAIFVSTMIYRLMKIETVVEKFDNWLAYISIGIVIIGFTYIGVDMYIQNDGYKDKYIQIKGESQIEQFIEQKQSFGNSNLIAKLKTKDGQILKIKVNENQNLRELNNKDVIKKGDKVKLTSNKKYQLKHNFNEMNNYYHLTKGSKLKKVE